MRLLLLLHDQAEAEGLATRLAELGVQAAMASSNGDALLRDPGAFEALVPDTHGSIEARIAECRRLRGTGYLGAIVAVCVDASEGQGLLDAGADDFVSAPCDPVELLTRLRAALQRATAHARLRWGGMELDRVSRIVRIADKDVTLTERECGLLACLMQAGGDVVSRATLRARVWQRTEDRGSNLVEVHMSRLREKLGHHATAVETVRRAGYRLRR